MKRLFQGLVAGVALTLATVYLWGTVSRSMTTRGSYAVPVRKSPSVSGEVVADRWTITLEGLLGSSLKISDGPRAQELHPPDGKVWGDAMLDPAGTAIYLIESTRIGADGYNPESLVRIPLPHDSLGDQTMRPK